MYNYQGPPGYGDIFFQYVYDAQDAQLVNGQDYYQKGIRTNDGQFVARYWSGLSWLADGLTIYDYLNRARSSGPMLLGGLASATDLLWAQQIMTPEIVYPASNGNIRFDLKNVQQNTAGTDGGLTIYKSQLVFSGVRRSRGVSDDPIPATYKYYEKPFSIPYDLSINNYASTGGALNPPVRYQILVDDFDFELRQIEMWAPDNGVLTGVIGTWFKILLYDANKVQRANRPVLANLLCHSNARLNNYFTLNNWGPTEHNQGELNFWPCPPMVYPVRSVIQFDITSLVVSPTALPVGVKLLFKGVRRIPCN